MQTQLLGHIDIDMDQLRPELQRASEFHYAEPYGEFLCGRPWKSCMLWTPGGKSGDNVIAHYEHDKEGGLTEHGRQMPYLFKLLSDAFLLEHLSFARIAVMSESVLVPHRDYVEFDNGADERPAHRLHVPLLTNSQSLFTESNTVFRMRVGEVWSLDVTKLHSAAVLSDEKRIHLILDFRDPGSARDLVRNPTEHATEIPKESVCNRPLLSDAEAVALLSLASFIELDNLKDVFGIVTKKHYRKDGGDDFVWRTMREIGRRSDNPIVDQAIQSLHTHYALTRAE
jgi:hypothetical protein